MDKYIKQLLELYSKVILPKFGAIVIEDEETGELMFNEYLNYNDGKLDQLIEKESNMELQEVQNMIAKYIRDIQAQIDKGETYDIFGLGSFSKNKDGEVEFSGNLKTGESKTSTPVSGPSPSASSAEPKEESKTAKPVEDKKEDKTENKNQKEETDKKENKYVPESKDEESPKKTEKDAGTKEDVTSKKGEAKEKEKKSKPENTDKKKAEADKKLASEKAEKEKAETKAKKKKEKEEAKKAKAKAKEDKKKAKEDTKKARVSGDQKSAKVNADKKQQPKNGKKKRKVGVVGWIAIIILLLAAGGGIFVGLNYDKVKSYMGWDEFEKKKELAENESALQEPEGTKDSEESNDDKASDQDEKNLEEAEESQNMNESNEDDGDLQETQDTQESQEEPVEETTSSSTPSSTGSYHLIAGGYRVKSNAQDAVSELKSKGLDARIIGRINGLHFVSAKSYSSLNSAKQDINNIRGKAPGAWIYKQ